MMTILAVVGSRPKQTCVDFTSAQGLILLWDKRALETLSYFLLQEAPGDDENTQTAHCFPGSELSLGCTRCALVSWHKDPLNQDRGSERKEQARKMKARTLSHECGEGQKERNKSHLT